MTFINKPRVDTRSLLVADNAFRIKRRHSLRWRLLTLLAIILSITLLVVAIGVYSFIVTTERQTWRQRQDEAARYAISVVTTFLDRTTSSLNAAGLFDEEMLISRPAALDQLLQQNPAFLEIVRLNEQGQVIGGAYQDHPIIANQFTIPQSVWFSQSNSGQLYLSSVQISASSQPYLIMAIPAASGGVTAARLRMNVLWEVVSDLNFGETGQTYIVNHDGQIVAHTNQQLALAGTNLSDLPEMEAINQATAAPWSGTYLNFNNLEVTGVMQPVPNTPWIIVTEVPASELVATSRTALLIIGGGMFAFGLIVMLMAGRFVGRLMLQPLERLRAGAIRIGHGELDYQFDLIRNDEVGQVANTFNEMVSRLRDREERLRQQREFLQQVIDINPHFIFAKDAQGKYTLVNKAFANAYHTTVEKLIGKSDRDINPNLALIEKYEREEQQVIATGQELRIDEEEIINIDGQSVWRKTIKRPIVDKDGVARQVLGVATDITDRKRAEAALAVARDQAMEASRLKTQLLSNVSHDLRTPLGGILGYAEMLQAGVYGQITPEQHEALAEVIDSTNQLLAFINNLLNQARIEAGKVVIKIAPLEPAALITDIKSMFGPLAQTKGLALTGDISPTVPPLLYGDIDWLRQMVANLVANAIKFTEQGSVNISIFSPSPGRWAIQVSDTGPGIPRRARQYVFEPFRQVDGTITRTHGGSGLGLSIVRELAILMGGEITLESQLGKGCTFTITLPLNPETQQAKEQTNGQPSDKRQTARPDHRR